LPVRGAFREKIEPTRPEGHQSTFLGELSVASRRKRRSEQLRFSALFDARSPMSPLSRFDSRRSSHPRPSRLACTPPMMRMGDAPPAAQSEAAQPPADVAAGAHSQAVEGTHIVHDKYLLAARTLACVQVASECAWRRQRTAVAARKGHFRDRHFGGVFTQARRSRHPMCVAPQMPARLRCARLWNLCMCRLACDVYAW